MALNGTWKIDRNENYEKFMEAMGKSIFPAPYIRLTPLWLNTQFVNCLLVNLSFRCLLLYPCTVCCIYFQNITIGGGRCKDPDKYSDFNYVNLK